MTDNLAAYYVAFGVAATFTHSTTVTSILVIFDRAGGLSAVGDIEVRNVKPTARCKLTDVTTAARGDTLVVATVTWYVIDIEPLNNEEVLLHLSSTT